MDFKYESFLNKLYQNLHMSEIVMRTASKKDNKDEKIRKYMERLEDVHELAWKGKYNSDRERLRSLYYAKYVIKEKEIPGSYYEHMKQIYLEQGYGYIEIPESRREELAKSLIDEQKSSLDKWLDYLMSDDAKFYPFALKYWAFQGMLNLGSFDKEKGKFKRRSKRTVGRFVELNREALALTISDMEKYLDTRQMGDDFLLGLLENGNFGKIYGYYLRELDQKKRISGNAKDGIWVKYAQNSDYRCLVVDLAGKGTGWCTVGDRVAERQLKNGDFYVYYTRDEKFLYTEPRIAIRMNGKDKIGEIRGVGSDQNIEGEMEVVLEEKLKEFPDREEYYKKVNDMKRLTEIYNKNKEDQELTNLELRFLYEIDRKIEGFGFEDDPRIGEIIESRNIRKDMAVVFNCGQGQVGTGREDLERNLVCYYGDLVLNDLTELMDFKFPRFVVGHVELKKLVYARKVICPEVVTGYLAMENLVEGVDLILPKKIVGNLYLNNLVDGTKVMMPEEVDGFVELCSLVKASGMVLPRRIGEYLSLYRLPSAKGLVMPSEIGGRIYLLNLIDVEGLRLKDDRIKLVVSDKMKKMARQNREIIFEDFINNDAEKVIDSRFSLRLEEWKGKVVESFREVKKKVRRL